MMEEGKTPGLIAIVPVKPLADSKTRLASLMTVEQRSKLVVGMLTRVLTAIREAGIDPVWVVGGDDRVKRIVKNFSVEWFEELGTDLNDTLAKAFDLVFERSCSALYVASDLPFLKPGDLHSLLQASRRNTNITLAPARRDGGTNAILVPPGLPFRPELGLRSFSRHMSKAAELGISVAICYSPGLGFDLDISDDLETFQHMEPDLLDRLESESQGR
jgi:2-phospho-L-lactate guanylyltransferase